MRKSADSLQRSDTNLLLSVMRSIAACSSARCALRNASTIAQPNFSGDGPFELARVWAERNFGDIVLHLTARYCRTDCAFCSDSVQAWAGRSRTGALLIFLRHFQMNRLFPRCYPAIDTQDLSAWFSRRLSLLVSTRRTSSFLIWGTVLSAGDPHRPLGRRRCDLRRPLWAPCPGERILQRTFERFWSCRNSLTACSSQC